MSQPLLLENSINLVAQELGPNLSDCMYHTMTAFKQGGTREKQAPGKQSLDATFPATGVQAL